MDGFKASLHALPQELYDEIFNLTFTKSEISRTIDATYKPPSSLHVNRATRYRFAKSHYGGGSIIYISRFTLRQFVNCLPLEHRLLLSEVRLIDAEVRFETSAPTRGSIENWVVVRNSLDAFTGLSKAVKFKNVYPDGTWKWVDYWQLFMAELEY